MCQTYKDMIQDLRDKAEYISLSSSNITDDYRVALKQAANAIERLCIENDCLSEDVTDLVRELNKQKWIPVTEKLPEIGKVVLAFGTRSATTGQFQGTAKTVKDWLWKGHTIKRVTHWMPLPEPPKEET